MKKQKTESSTTYRPIFVEGKVRKGGVNLGPPKTPRPSPPVGRARLYSNTSDASDASDA